MDILDRKNYALRDVTDLFEMVSINKELFENKHEALIEIAEKFINYYIENTMDLYKIMHPSVTYTSTEEEELWVTDDEWEGEDSTPVPQEALNSIENEIEIKSEEPLVPLMLLK